MINDPMSASTAFRLAMRRMAASVNIITITADGVPQGMAATAVSSLAMEPASLLVCINTRASMHDAIAETELFCVNLLHHAQMSVAQAFSDNRPREQRFHAGDWCFDPVKPPRLTGAQAAITCRRVAQHGFGTHSIFIGVVADVAVREDVDPMVYLDGRFGHVAD